MKSRIDWEEQDAKRNGYLEVKKLKEQGEKLVGIFCSYTPIELVMAAGARAVSLCGGSETGILAAETRLPKNLCPLIKDSYGVLEVTLMCCHTFAIEDYSVKKMVTEQYKKPYLHIDTDYSQADSAQIETRMGAFIELLESK